MTNWRFGVSNLYFPPLKLQVFQHFQETCESDEGPVEFLEAFETPELSQRDLGHGSAPRVPSAQRLAASLHLQVMCGTLARHLQTVEALKAGRGTTGKPW